LYAAVSDRPATASYPEMIERYVYQLIVYADGYQFIHVNFLRVMQMAGTVVLTFSRFVGVGMT
jgi:hypothetical protein